MPKSNHGLDKQEGKIKLTEEEQVLLIHKIINSSIQYAPNKEIYDLITGYKNKIELNNQLPIAIDIANQFIIELEAVEHGDVILDHLKQLGLYRMLYRRPKLQGIELPKDDVLHQLLRSGLWGVGVSAVLIAVFLATTLLAAPAWLIAISTGLFIGASIYLSGLLYGVVNDLFATHSNLPYFLLGHQPQQYSMFRSNDKVVNGIGWGIAATFGPVLLATILFVIVSTITAFFVPMATFIIPIMMIAMPLIAVGAELYSRAKIKEYIEKNTAECHWVGANEYQQRNLAFMCPTKAERAAWHANSDRNMFGFTKVPFVGLSALVALIVLSGVSMFLPPVLISLPLVALILPAAFSAAACLALAGGGLYVYLNQDKQTDNRYRMDFDSESVDYNLYLDEDMDTVDLFFDKSSKSANSDLSSSKGQYFPGLFPSKDIETASMPKQSYGPSV
jgi:hypothetical protein